MSSTRVDLQSDHKLETVIGDLRTDVDGLKTKNQAFGSDALRIQRSGRASGWDVSISVAPYALKSYRCSFLASSVAYPYLEFTPNVSVTNTTGYEVLTYYPDMTVFSPRNRAWILTLSNDANTVTFNFAAAFKCTDSGTVTVTAI